MLRSSFISIAILVLAACAGPNPGPDSRSLVLSEEVLELLRSDESVTLGDPRIRCETSKGLGTNFPRQFCMTKAQFERHREWSLTDVFGPSHNGTNN